MLNVISVNILGKTHTYRTDKDQNRMQAIADIVNKKIYEAAAKRNMPPSENFAMGAALAIAADLYQLREDYQRLLKLAKGEDEEE